MTHDNPEIPDEAERLFELPLDEFVAERRALASALRHAGRRAEAQNVSKLPKPTVAAWAANQILRSQRRDVGRLLKAGTALEQAQDAAIGGAGDNASLRESLQEHREALDQLTRALRGLLDAHGHSLTDAVILRARDTLAAISLDPELRPYASAGNLTKEHTFAGGFELSAARVGEEHLGAQPRRGGRETPRRSRPGTAKGATGREPPGERRTPNVLRVREAERAERAATEAVERAAREVDVVAAKLGEAKRAHSAAQRELKAAKAALRRAARSE
jgi:hypothetical protein